MSMCFRSLAMKRNDRAGKRPSQIGDSRSRTNPASGPSSLSNIPPLSYTNLASRLGRANTEAIPWTAAPTSPPPPSPSVPHYQQGSRSIPRPPLQRVQSRVASVSPVGRGAPREGRGRSPLPLARASAQSRITPVVYLDEEQDTRSPPPPPSTPHPSTTGRPQERTPSSVRSKVEVARPRPISFDEEPMQVEISQQGRELAPEVAAQATSSSSQQPQRQQVRMVPLLTHQATQQPRASTTLNPVQQPLSAQQIQELTARAAQDTIAR
jgi:hypothetical protein